MRFGRGGKIYSDLGWWKWPHGEASSFIASNNETYTFRLWNANNGSQTKARYVISSNSASGEFSAYATNYSGDSADRIELIAHANASAGIYISSKAGGTYITSDTGGTILSSNGDNTTQIISRSGDVEIRAGNDGGHNNDSDIRFYTDNQLRWQLHGNGHSRHFGNHDFYGDVNFTQTSNAVINFIIDGGALAIETGVKGDIEIPWDCTIIQNTVLADQSGSIVIDIWKDTYANFPPTVADTITASALPTITTSTKSQDATLTGWTVDLSEGDILRFNVNSVTSIQRATLSLKVSHR